MCDFCRAFLIVVAKPFIAGFKFKCLGNKTVYEKYGTIKL